MKTGNKIDDLFRESMTGYQIEPTPGLWRRIERRFFPPSRFSPSGLITSAILIFIAGLMPWVLIPAKGGQPKELEVHQEGHHRGYILYPSDPGSVSVTGNEKTYSVQTTYINTEQTAQVPENKVTITSENIRDHSDDIQGNFIASTDPQSYYSPIYAKDGSPETYREPLWILKMHMHRAGLMYPAYSHPPQPSIRDIEVKSAFRDDYESSYFKNSESALGFSFNPSLVFYDPNPNNKMLGGEAYYRYSVGNWNLTGGIGYSRMEDQGTYGVNYTSYDSVGFFIDVVSFIPDPRNPGNIVYTTQKKTIYDSVPHYSITEKTNLYSYLDFPVTLGYTFFQQGRVSLSANAGIKFSVLVGKNEPTVDFYIPNGELTEIIREVPPRLNTNWRFTAGIDFGYTLTSQVSFHLEPVFEQYISPVYAKQPGVINKKPYVAGLKAGFRYTFK